MKLCFVIAPEAVLYIKPEEITPGKIVHRNDAGQIVAKLNQEGLSESVVADLAFSRWKACT